MSQIEYYMNKIILPLFFLISGLLFSQTNVHRVQPKETLYGLSKQYKMSQEELKEANPFLKKRGLQVGDILNIPGKNKPNVVDSPVNEIEEVHVKNYEDDDFYFRVIKPKETLYSLSKEYKVTQDAIKSLNPFIERRGLQVGDVVRIAREGETKTESKSPKGFHKVEEGETVYSIAKKNNVEPADIYAANRGLQKDGLKKDSYIKVPVDNIKVGANDFKHTVKSKETIFSILKKYDITLTELLESNPDLSNGLKAGMELNIPFVKGADMAYLNVKEEAKVKKGNYSASTDGHINIAMILPFYLNEKKSYKGERTIAKEFYMGAQVALDELIKKGKKINLKVIDSQNDNSIIDNFIKSDDIYKYDALIGPFFQEGLIHTAQTLEKLKTPIFSPVINTETVDLFGNVYIPTPKDEYSADIIAEEIIKDYKGEKIQLLTTKEEKNLANYLKKLLSKKIKNKQIEIISDVNEIAPKIEMKGDEKQVTPVIAVLVSENNVLGKKYVESILKLKPEEIKGYSVFFVPALDVFDTSNISNINALKKINFVYTASRMINSFGQSEKQILSSFENKYCQLPTKYMALGYDIMYDVVDRMNESGVISKFDEKRVETRLAGKFSYEKSPTGEAKVNKSIRVIRLN